MAASSDLPQFYYAGVVCSSRYKVLSLSWHPVSVGQCRIDPIRTGNTADSIECACSIAILVSFSEEGSSMTFHA